MIVFRKETTGDREAIQRLIKNAFGQSEFGYHGESDLVNQIRANCKDLLSMVAEDAGQVIGHIFFSPVTIQTAKGELPGMGLAPMAVKPERQNSGVGTALIDAGLRELVLNECPFVVVLGHPSYYPKFGFQLANEYEITHGFKGIPQNVLFVKSLSSIRLEELQCGLVRYRDEFGPQFC